MNVSDNAKSVLNLSSNSPTESNLADTARSTGGYVGIVAGVTSNSNLDGQISGVARKGAVPLTRKGGTTGNVRFSGNTRK